MRFSVVGLVAMSFAVGCSSTTPAPGPGDAGAAGSDSGSGADTGSSSGEGGTSTCTRDTAHDTTCSDFWSSFGKTLPHAYNCSDPFEADKIDSKCNSTSSGGWNGYCCP